MNTNGYKLRRGHILLIKELVAHVQQKITSSGLQHFKATSKINSEPETRLFTSSQYLLRKLLSAADQNCNRKKGGYRYDTDIKLIASYIRTIIGRFGYTTIQRNLEAALPSSSSTNRYIKDSNCHVTEGVLRCQELLVYLNERKLPLVVSLSEDCTKVEDTPQYCSVTNQIIGFVPPIDKSNGMPIPFQYPARNADEILHHFESDHAVSTNLDIVMAQPLGDASYFCLLAFGTDCAYTAEDIRKRWCYIISELNKLNITVLTVASDSDPKYNSAMRTLSKIGNPSECDWFSCDVNSDGPFFIQDPIHIATKMRNFLLSFFWKKHELSFGKYFIRPQHLTTLISVCRKDRHLLTASTLDQNDRQNFNSVQRMCSREVILCLREMVADSEGTIQYLQIIRDVYESFLDHNFTPLQRIRKLWYSLFLIRIWRQSIVAKKEYTLKNNFLTSYCYSCIEINAHSLVLCLIYLKKINKPELFKPFRYDSQTCESAFRALRSMSTVYSQVTNWSLKGSLARLSRMQLQAEIIHRLSPNFIFPRINQLYYDSKQNTIYPLPTPQEIYNEIIFTKKNAVNIAIKLGMMKKCDASKISLKCELNPYDTSNFRNKKRVKISKKAQFHGIYSFKNIQLKDYTGKLKTAVLDEKSPYTEIHNSTGRTIIVRKSSLCWLLRKDRRKLSSDRIRRVMGPEKKTIMSAHNRKNKTKETTSKLNAYKPMLKKNRQKTLY